MLKIFYMSWVEVLCDCAFYGDYVRCQSLLPYFPINPNPISGREVFHFAQDDVVAPDISAFLMKFLLLNREFRDGMSRSQIQEKILVCISVSMIYNF